MMKFLLTIGLMVFALVSLIAGKGSDAERAGFRGRVKFVERYEIYFCCSPNQRKRLPKKLTGTTTFNKKGGYVEWISINNTSDGPYYSRRVFKYDERGRKIGAEEYRSEKNPAETYFELVRGADGSVKLSPERAEKLTERIVYRYDGVGRLIKEESRDINENLILRKLFQYDRDGNMVRSTMLKADGTIDNESITVISEGRRFESTYLRPGMEVQRSVYERDSKGRTLWGEAFGLKQISEKEARWVSLNKSRHTYSEGRERMDWIIKKPDGGPGEKVIILSDESGEAISREEFNAGPLPVGSQNEDIEPPWTLRERNLYRREYDKKGNEVRSETRQQCGPDLPLELTNIYETVITYY